MPTWQDVCHCSRHTQRNMCVFNVSLVHFRLFLHFQHRAIARQRPQRVRSRGPFSREVRFLTPARLCARGTGTFREIYAFCLLTNILRSSYNFSLRVVFGFLYACHFTGLKLMTHSSPHLSSSYLNLVNK